MASERGPTGVLLTDLNLLRVIVARSGLTQRQIADRAGCSPGTVGNLLAGRRTGCSADVYVALLDVLGVGITAAFERRRKVAA